MAKKEVKTRIIHKHDKEANWLLAANFVPMPGELIVYDADETHSKPRFKVGNGVDIVSDLPFSSAVTSWNELEDKPNIDFDNMVLITVEDIDEIWGDTIQYAEEVLF